jgi:hypothetical protein
MQISSLTNCEFSIEEKNNFSSFKLHLNKYGLFSDIVIANRYKLASDLRVKEHSPFYIYGLYKVDQKIKN